jgi:hypothetical protein
VKKRVAFGNYGGIDLQISAKIANDSIIGEVKDCQQTYAVLSMENFQLRRHKI